MKKNHEELIEKAAIALMKSDFAVGLTGAGISAESGIPTFRGKNGLWSKFKAEELATPQAFKRNPNLVWEWYKWRMEKIFNTKPNLGHYALVELEQLGILKYIITQNVDGLHQIAGSKFIIELHGSIRRGRCIKCRYIVAFDKPPRDIPPRCPECNNLLRPDVVWFGEPIPEDKLKRAIKLFSIADVALIIGTSGVVQPAGYLPYITKEHGGIIIEINIRSSAITSIADIFINEKASYALTKIVSFIKNKTMKKSSK
ncbi:MAG TPA: NAD-dependent deacylase, partial [Candidatus Atribacteria bacterium]|nr:NAD-dependent deacylase [Candidatus Atribacteria bacterium]